LSCEAAITFYNIIINSLPEEVNDWTVDHVYTQLDANGFHAKTGN